MGFVHQRDNKIEFDVLQVGMLSPKLFTEFLQDISKSFNQGQVIPIKHFINSILVICRRPCPFFLILLIDCKNN